MKNLKKVVALTCCLVMFFLANVALADTMSVVNVFGDDGSSAVFTVDWNNISQALTVNVSNTTSPNLGDGAIGNYYFNAPSGITLIGETLPDGTTSIFSPSGVYVPGYGLFNMAVFNINLDYGQSATDVFYFAPSAAQQPPPIGMMSMGLTLDAQPMTPDLTAEDFTSIASIVTNGSDTPVTWESDFNGLPDMIPDSNVAPVPEPGTLILAGFGLFCIAVFTKRRQLAFRQID